ncbi:oxygen-independent coproporphyrinogen III oxidase [Halomonas binhaiensis]|uniref:Coproporphyrinogen-III oxidase n=1 Tax=Halomonas binhaiensis TaxID=2562282 RepID=A0A5C1NLL7_9GAMM|nr:oxygen-independent coproporphyrinogen III oxidase [Halomonas binhaiensis]QEM83621.1 oxygen-independent coproporphyrinogen III oxidase [Halomonas binhaiensis]
MSVDVVPFQRHLAEKYDRPGPRYTSYPTAPHFQDAYDAHDYLRAVSKSHRHHARPLSVYIHVPFCESLCYYCACSKIITHNRERASEYLDYLKREIVLQAALFDENRELSQLHLGGGTPTFLSNDQLAELVDALSSAFHFSAPETREFSLEVDPRTVSTEQISQLRELGFNRVSFGVQDFDERVQRAVNRVQSEAQVTALMASAREAGFASVSVDLIYGLPLQTIDSFATTLEKVIALRPDRIAAYSYAHLPSLFKAQRLIRNEDMPPPERKLELLELTISRLTQAGYVYIGMDHFALPEDELSLARQDGTLQRNFQGYSTRAECDMIGLGVTAIGRMADAYSQNVKTTAEYMKCLDAGELPVLRGYVLSAEDHLRADVITAVMCHGQVDFSAIEKRHDIIFREHFSAALEALEEMQDDGLVTIDAQYLRVLPSGRLMLRNVAMAFDAYLGEGAGRYSRTV